jgi:hypothetical protein
VNERPQLTIGYSTLANRVENIVFPSLPFPHRILISVQNPTQTKFTIPASQVDVSVIESSETGVTKSRNKVLANTTTELLVFADDDASISATGLTDVLEFFSNHPECDLVTAMTVNEKGQPRKSYPKKATKLSLFNSAKVGTIEMVLRVESARSRGVTFDENFGAGALNKLGDEYIFISDLLKRGGQGVFLPIVLASHPDESSGANQSESESEGDLEARAKVFSRVFGWKSPMIRAVFYLRRRQNRRNIKSFIRFVRG